MNFQLNTDQIKQNLQTLYPQLFDDDNAKDKLDPLIVQADTLLAQYKSSVTKAQYEQLVELLAAHLLYQSEDHNVSEVQVADVHVETESYNDRYNDNDAADSDPYLLLLDRLLKALGFTSWGIQLD